MPKYTRHAAVNFSCLETAGFCPKMYSRLKFGSDQAARKMGHQLADSFFAAHAPDLLANRHVVISSPYNHVPNAATVMTKHFVDKLNQHLVFARGEHVEYSITHRKVSYTSDYGFLSKDQRKGLIDNDSFYLNRDFIQDKTLILVDDIRITGTHEDKLREILIRDNVANDAYFLYFAEYFGKSAEIEAQLNFSAIDSLDDYYKLSQEPNHHIIIRPIKYILSRDPYELGLVIKTLVTDRMLDEIYFGCLAEGYYKLPNYQENFKVIVDEKNRRDENKASLV